MTTMRSLLLVSGDREEALSANANAMADALVLDLWNTVPPERKSAARNRVREFLEGRPAEARQQGVWVRINTLEHAEAGADLGAVMPFRPDGIVLPGARSVQDVEALATRIGHYEAEHEIAIGTTRILAMTAGTAASVFTLGGYAAGGRRLSGLTWDAQGLELSMGAQGIRDESGLWTEPFGLVRALCLLGAHAAGVAAIDTLHTELRDVAGLERSCREARRDGFSGKFAIHTDQLETINQAFG